MKIKKIIVFLLSLALLSFSGVQAQQNKTQQGMHEAGTGLESTSSDQGGQQQGKGQDESQGQGESRRSKVANSVQKMLQIAERNEGIGQQIRTVAQSQNRIQEEAEESLDAAKQRRGFMKFLIGPDYEKINKTKEKIQKHEENIKELENLKNDIENQEDVNLLENQIQVLKNAKQEIQSEVKEVESGFSLFGWMNRFFNR